MRWIIQAEAELQDEVKDVQVVHIPEFMCQQSSRDLVFQILSNFQVKSQYTQNGDT